MRSSTAGVSCPEPGAALATLRASDCMTLYSGFPVAKPRMIGYFCKDQDDRSEVGQGETAGVRDREGWDMVYVTVYGAPDTAQ